MLGYNDYLLMIYNILRAHKRHNELIWSTATSFTEIVIQKAERMNKNFPPQYRSYAHHIEAYRKMMKNNNGLGLAVHQPWVKFPNKRKKSVFEIEDGPIEKYGAVIPFAEYKILKRCNVIFFAVTMVNSFVDWLSKPDSKPAKISDRKYIEIATLRVMWHERRHLIQHYLMDTTGSFVAHTIGRKGWRMTESSGRYVNRRKETEWDAHWWSDQQLEHQHGLVKCKSKW